MRDPNESERSSCPHSVLTSRPLFTTIVALGGGQITTVSSWNMERTVTAPYLRRILPRSLHRPLAVVEGSLTEKFIEIGVRLWTDCSGLGDKGMTTVGVTSGPRRACS